MLDLNEPVFFRGLTHFIVLPVVNADTITPTVTIPNVKALNVLICKNTGAITITNFTGGSPNQSIKLIGDGFTTIKNNSTIVTNTGVDRLLGINKAYNFTLIGSVWIEDAD